MISTTMTWAEFLQDHGAEINNDHVISFGQPAREANAAIHDNIIISLSSLVVIEVTGSDAEFFLQGQFTCDLNTLTTDQFLLCAWCNAKGQVYSNFYIFRNKSSFILLVPDDICESFFQRIKMYILRSDVVVNNKHNELICIGIKHKDKTTIKTAVLPDKINMLVNQNDYFSMRVMDNDHRYILVGTIDVIKNIWQQVSSDVTPVATQHWQMLDILAGVPWINNLSIEKYLPQFLNLDVLNSVSFEKGCFPGQEIIARLRYRGEVKRRLYLASVQQDKAPDIGEDLFLNSNEKSVGIILNTSPHPEYGHVFLAVIENEHANSENIYLKNSDSIISIHSLPYNHNVE